MRNLIVAILAIISFFISGCSATLTTVRENRGSFSLSEAEGKTIAILPFRGTHVKKTAIQIVRTQFCEKLIRTHSDIYFLYQNTLIRQFASLEHEINSKYTELMKDFYSRGTFKQGDMEVFDSAGIDYLMAISLDEKVLQQYELSFSLQIWDIKTGKIVWDLAEQGQIETDVDEYDHNAQYKLSELVTSFVYDKFND